MEERIIMHYTKPGNLSLSTKDVIAKLNELDISGIKLCDYVLENFSDGSTKHVATDHEHPIALIENNLFINPDYFKEHSTEINQMIEYIGANQKENKFYKCL